MQELEDAVRFILSTWGVIALVLGPIAFFRARKYFPERNEAVSPDQLRQELGKVDHAVRDSFNVEMSRLRLSLDENHREVMAAVRDAHARADAAWERSKEALHKGEIVEEKVNGFKDRVIERLDHLEEMLRQLRQVRRGEQS